MDSPVIYIFYHLIISCRLNVRFNMQSCVHSFYYFFFCPTDRPTFARVKAMGNETFYWDGLKVTSTLRPITAFLLAPFWREKAKTGRNSDNRRAMPAESTLATSRLVCNCLAFTPTAEPGHKLKGTQRQFPPIHILAVNTFWAIQSINYIRSD